MGRIYNKNEASILKILCFTGSRAEYYILKPLFTKLSKKEKVNLELIVSGGITKEEHFQTLKDIKKDCIKINSIIDIPNQHKTHPEMIGFLCLKLTPIITNFSQIYVLSMLIDMNLLHSPQLLLTSIILFFILRLEILLKVVLTMTT